MQTENEDIYLPFNKINDAKEDLSDEVISKGLYLNDCLKKDNLAVVDELVVDILESQKEKEDN